MRSLLIATFLIFTSASAFAVTLDFEEPGIDYGEAGSSYDFFKGPVTTKGFQISYICEVEPCDGEFVEDATVTGYNDSTILAWGPDGTVKIEALNLIPFDLVSMDFGTAYGGDYSVLGHYAAGGTVQINYSEPDPFILQNITFDAAWSDLVAVDLIMLSGPGMADNIVINQVPIPAAVWLFGSALAGLGWLRRKRTA